MSSGPLNPIELSPDLEWMLQSGQASDALLAETLAAEYYASVYRLALAVLDDADDAGRAAREALVTAVVNRHRYQPEFGVKLWLYALAVDASREVFYHRRRRWWWLTRRVHAPVEKQPPAGDEALWGVFDALEEKYRLPLLLRFAHELTEAEVVRALRGKDELIRGNLETAIQRIRPANPPEDWAKLLTQAMQSRWAAPDLSERALEKINAAIQKQASQRRSGKRFALSAREVILGLMIAMLALVVSGLLDFINPEPSPVRTVIVTRLVPITTPPTPTATLLPLPQPAALNLDSTSQEISQRMLESSGLWRTMWVDVTMTIYESAYQIEPGVYRVQVWLKGSDRLILFGPYGARPDFVWYITDENVYELKISNYSSHFYPTEQPDILPREFFIVYQVYIEPMFLPDTLAQPTELFQTVGYGTISWRDLLIVDDLPLSRLWVDRRKGVILRWEKLSQADGVTVEADMEVTKIIFDADMQSDIFIPGHIPWFDRFVESARGQSFAPIGPTATMPSQPVLELYP